MSNNPQQRFCLKVWGDLAAFNRPELKVERFTYDIITPSAARGILTAIFWKPAVRWHIRKIEVLNPIRTISILKNEVAALASPDKSEIFIEEKRQQKSGVYLRDVAYRIHADMEYLPPGQRINDKPNPNPEKGPETPVKYFAMFERRASKGQTFHNPYFGTRECPAFFEFIPASKLEQETASHPPLSAEYDRDFGIMLFDMDFSNVDDPQAMFFHAVMRNGCVEVPDESEVLR